MTVEEFLNTVTKEDLLNLWMDEVYQLYNNEGFEPRREITKEDLILLKDKYCLRNYNCKYTGQQIEIVEV